MKMKIEGGVILDAKYKRLQKENGFVKTDGDDVYQMITYMFITKFKNAILINPYEMEKLEKVILQKKSLIEGYSLTGYGGQISVLSFPIPQGNIDFVKFLEVINKIEIEFKKNLFIEEV